MDITNIFDKYAEKALRVRFPTFRFEDDSFYAVLTYEESTISGCCSHGWSEPSYSYITFHGAGLTKTGKRRTYREMNYPVSLDTDNLLSGIQVIVNELENKTW